MCGLAGMIDPRLSLDEGGPLLDRMLFSIRHRGPDSSGTWVDGPVWLGHNRLSILDLSELGNQPMHYDDLVIVHNGEVYNYLELRRELEERGLRFRSESDTEVIVAAYKAWGAACVERFIGMWAFAIWDRTRRELFCSRDRFGIKPFYYIHAGDRFYFGSEYKPLKLSPLFRSELNRDQIRRGLHVGGVAYRDETYYQCLKALPERSNLLFKDGNVVVSQYWDLDARQRFTGTFDEKRQRFLELFRDSVRLQMRSDVPVAGMLSGGIDSSSITSIVGTDFSNVPYKAFTIYYGGWRKMDERPWASIVASAFPNVEHVTFTPTDDDLAASYDTIVDAFDTPVPAATPVNAYFVLKGVAEHGLKVVLDGQGADEYLAGYFPSYDRQIAQLLRRLRLIKALTALRDYRRERSTNPLATLRVAATSVLAAAVDEEALYVRHFHPTLKQALTRDVPISLPHVPGSRMQQNDYHLIFGWYLPSLLHYGDRMSMISSVESRVPFLDHRLVEFAFGLDDDDKIHRGRTKHILRESLAGVLATEIAARRDKQPFLGGEVDHWLRGPLRFLTETPIDFDGLGLIPSERANELVREFRDGERRLAGWIWSLAGLNYWLRRN
jgi:asparagine synthase (glutamine-hydrolysing)